MIKSILNDCYKPITAYIGSKQVWQYFTPADLFLNGEQGVWFDPSDFSTMLQIVNRIQPVTKDGDPVGLILDKSQGITKRVMTSGKVNLSDWEGSGLDDIQDGRLKIGKIPNEGEVNKVFLSQKSDYKIEAGKTYRVAINITETVDIDYGLRLFYTSLTKGPIYHIGLYLDNNNRFVHIFTPSVDGYLGILKISSHTGYQVVDSVKLEELVGYHAKQTTSASRPIHRTDGKLHWLEFDGVDDTLITELPPGTYTEIKSSRDEVIHRYPVIVESTYTLGDLTQVSENISGLVLINRQLSQDEIENVTNLMRVKAGLSL